MEYKIIYPSGYTIHDIHNDNIDVIVLLEDKRVYTATFITLQNISYHMERKDSIYDNNFFWIIDMIIIKDLSKECINYVVEKIIGDDSINDINKMMLLISPINNDDIEYWKQRWVEVW